MALIKRNYVSGETVITATNLNDIQDSIIALEGKGLTKEEVVDALEYTPAKASDIPTADISANTAARHSHSNKDVLDNIAEITSISGGAVTGGANALVTKEVLDATSQLIMDEMPSELKNPYALTFEGAASGAYDGSSAVTINIPSGFSCVNVKDHGAKGDGVTDDTTAVQNALNDAQGKTLIIDGVCKITAPLVVKDNTEIIGIGSRASGFDSHVAGTLFISENANGIYKCLFENLRIRNRNLSPTDTDGQYVGQVFSSLYESRVTECYIEHFAQICSRMARISSIDHCEMYYINKSLVNDVIDSMIESNYINARNTAAGRTIMVHGLFSNSMFSNNFCDYWGTAFRLESGSKPSNVIGNTFDNCVSVFRDYVAGLSIVGNNYTNIKYVSANWQAGGQPSATIQATKWSVFKFDGATVSHTGASTQCCLSDTTFNSNTFGNCSYYIDVENGVSVYPVQRCKFFDNAWEGLLVDAAFTNPQSAYDNGGMRTVYFDFWEGQSVDVLPSAKLVSNLAKSVATYDGMTLWYKKREIRNFNGAWRFADGSVLSNEIWDLADRNYEERTVPANTPRTYSAEKWYKVNYNGSEYTDDGYAFNPIVSNITKNGFTIQTKNTMAGLGFYLPYGEFTFSATLPTGIEAYLLIVNASGVVESRNQVKSGATLNCKDVSKSYVLLFCSRTTTGTYTVSNISIRDNSYAEVSTAPYYLKEESQTKSIEDIAGYYTNDTVEGALAEIGGTLDELKNASGGTTGSITVDSALSATSTNPVQNKVIKSALDGKLSTSGGTLTGNLTGKYITGTWLQTTAASELSTTPTKIPVLDSNGWVYYRTLAHLKSDLGVPELSSSSITTALGYTPVKSSDIPTALKNPKALKFTGGATGTYDGSSELTINIPSGGGGSATGNELQYKGEWLSSENYQANDVVDDGTGKFYLYTGSSNGDPPDLDWENAKPFINETGSIALGEVGFVCSGVIYEVFKYLLNTTTSDTGKFLRVNSAGKPAWESVPSGEGVNF